MSDLVGLNFLRKRYGVTHRQIHSWYVRRTGGFPDPAAFTEKAEYPGGKAGTPLFDLDAVDRWHEQYDPNAGRGAHWEAKRRKQLPLASGREPTVSTPVD